MNINYSTVASLIIGYHRPTNDPIHGISEILSDIESLILDEDLSQETADEFYTAYVALCFMNEVVPNCFVEVITGTYTDIHKGHYSEIIPLEWKWHTDQIKYDGDPETSDE